MHYKRVTDRRTDRRTDKRSYRVASERLKTTRLLLAQIAAGGQRHEEADGGRGAKSFLVKVGNIPTAWTNHLTLGLSKSNPTRTRREIMLGIFVLLHIFSLDLPIQICVWNRSFFLIAQPLSGEKIDDSNLFYAWSKSVKYVVVKLLWPVSTAPSSYVVVLLLLLLLLPLLFLLLLLLFLLFLFLSFSFSSSSYFPQLLLSF